MPIVPTLLPYSKQGEMISEKSHLQQINYAKRSVEPTSLMLLLAILIIPTFAAINAPSVLFQK